MKTKALSMLVVVAAVVGCASTPGGGREDCPSIDEAGVKALLVRWSDSLRDDEAEEVVDDNYAVGSILLATLEAKPLVERDDKVRYFYKLQDDQPTVTIQDVRKIGLGCAPFDAGLYTFRLNRPGETVPARYTFTYGWNPEKGKWLITSHHSSKVP